MAAGILGALIVFICISPLLYILLFDQPEMNKGIRKESWFGPKPKCPKCGHSAFLHREPNVYTGSGCCHRGEPIVVDYHNGEYSTMEGLRCRCCSTYDGVLIAARLAKEKAA